MELPDRLIDNVNENDNRTEQKIGFPSEKERLEILKINEDLQLMIQKKKDGNS